METKRKLHVLIVDQALKESDGPNPPFFMRCGSHGYDMVVFPFRDDKPTTEVIYFSPGINDDLLELFGPQDYHYGDTFSDFDLDEIDLETFYDILSKSFEIIPRNFSAGIIDVKKG